METVKLEYSGQVRSLQLNPGDKVIVQFAVKVPAPYLEQVRTTLQKLFPSNEVLVIASVANLGIIRAGSDVPTRI